MSTITRGVLDQLGPESKISLSMKSIDVKDLVGRLDLSNSITKENVITVDLINGKYVTKIRIPNNVLIYKEDLKEIPLLLEVIDQGDVRGSSIKLDTFPLETQTKIALVFMIHYGYCTRVNNEDYFTPHILDLFNTEWWTNIFDLARENTLNYIDLEVNNGNQPTKNRELIYDTGLISVNEFKAIQLSPGMDTLWALGIYFFDKIIRNWEDQELPQQVETDTIMDIDIAPGKYIKTLDAKKFFLNQLHIFLGLRPNKIWFGGYYQSKFYEMIQKKSNALNKTIILEEMQFFVTYMNNLYSGGNAVLNGPNDSGTEPFAITDLTYEEIDEGIHTTIILRLTISINLYGESQVYTLPVTTKLN